MNPAGIVKSISRGSVRLRYERPVQFLSLMSIVDLPAVTRELGGIQ